MSAPTLLWFRQDLRLQDQPAVAAAIRRGGPVIGAYVLDDETSGRWAIGGASRWWLHHSLHALGEALRGLGIPLLLHKGKAATIIPKLVKDSGAEAIFWCRQYEPYARARDEALKRVLRKEGIEAESFNGALLFEPWDIKKSDGGPFRVFTPFWRACLAGTEPDAPKRRPGKPPPTKGDAIHLNALGLLPKPNWAGGLESRWTPGEAGARKALDRFLDGRLAHYSKDRDQPGEDGTSALSPHLHFGEISPRTVWHAVKARVRDEPGQSRSAEIFLKELGWREFSHHLLFHNPAMPEEPLDARFGDFPWTEDRGGFRAWTQGKTGYPLVDAGIRELWQTGYMHNRVRMIAASFLIKHLLLPWQHGEAWFWDTLVDADLANNAMGWQWVAGCGADAAPFFRIFNPVLQGERFDADGAYVRRYVPELAKLPHRYIHNPWTAPNHVLDDAAVTLGKTYPAPIIGHAEARARALSAFNMLRSTA